MKKQRKPVDELRWVWAHDNGSIVIASKHEKLEVVRRVVLPRETVVRVRITEVRKKKRRSKR